jgi:hypothetical protein
MAIKAKLAAGPAFHGQTDLGKQLLHCSRRVIDHVFRRFPAIRATCAQGASALRSRRRVRRCGRELPAKIPQVLDDHHRHVRVDFSRRAGEFR